MDTTDIIPNFYSAAPILEAVIEIRLAEPLGNLAKTKIQKRLMRNYVNFAELHEREAKVDLANQTTSYSKPRHIGTLSSGDETDRLVIRPANYVWARLAPYQGWSPYIERVARDLEDIHAVAGYQKVERIGVRYINRIDVPVSDDVIVRYEDYLALCLKLPDEMESINNYSWRFERSYLDRGLLAIVSSATVAAEVPGTGAFTLDIDVIMQDQPPSKINDILRQLEVMRELKNEIFEQSITDRARKSFQ